MARHTVVMENAKNLKPSLSALAAYDRERIEDADRRLRGSAPSDGFTPDCEEDLDDILSREMQR